MSDERQPSGRDHWSDREGTSVDDRGPRWVSWAEHERNRRAAARRRAIEHAGRCVPDDYDVLADRDGEDD